MESKNDVDPRLAWQAQLEDDGNTPPELTFAEYQAGARSTALYPDQARVVYPVLGLAGEVGELCEKMAEALFPEGAEGLSKEEYGIRYALQQAAAAGKGCEYLKKLIRDKRDSLPAGFLAGLATRAAAISDAQKAGLTKEQGDTLWYEAALAGDLEAALADTAQANLDKLAARKSKGTLQGSGDNR
jgi:hypothetical protein